VTPGDKARRLLRRCRFGALATLSVRLSGHPFATVVPYVLDQAGQPLLLISSLAEHTKNLGQEPRASLMVHATDVDVLAAARVTCAGRAERLDDPPALCVERYLRYLPKARGLLEFGDFAFYRIEPQALHWVGGFGDIQWISADAYRAPASTLEQDESGILDHMNADHAATLRDYCRFAYGREVLDAEMTGIDCDGFDVRADGDLLRFDFDAPVTTPDAARAALVELARRARG
jgi:putative heme iron utilization protein